MTRTRMILLSLLLLGIAGCSGEADVEIYCPYSADPIYASVDGGTLRFIDYGMSRTWTVKWTGGLFGAGTEDVVLYAEDYYEPYYYNETRRIEVENDGYYTWTIGWSPVKAAEGASVAKELVETPPQ